MIGANARRLPGGTPDATNIEITASSTEGRDEIGSVTVLDTLGTAFLLESMPDCLATFQRNITITQRRLPITIRVTECGTGTQHDFPGLIPPDSGVRPCDPTDTSPPSRACTLAQRDVDSIREDIRRICNSIIDLDQQIDSLRFFVAGALIAATALLVAAVVVALFGYAATVLAFLAAFVAIIAVAIGLWRLSLMSRRLPLRVRLNNFYSEFNRQADIVRNLCCPHEVNVDLTPPPCSASR